MTEGCCKLSMHLDNNIRLPCDAQGNNPELHSRNVLSGSTVTFEFQLISHTVFFALCSESHRLIENLYIFWC